MARNPDNPAYRKLSYPQARKVEEFLLSGICMREGEYAVYAPTWNDDKVAQHMAQINPDMTFISGSQVKNLRRQMIGKLRLPNGPPETELQTRVRRDEIEAFRKDLVDLAEEVRSLKQEPSLPYQPFKPLIPMLERLAKVESRVQRLFDAFDLKDEP